MQKRFLKVDGLVVGGHGSLLESLRQSGVGVAGTCNVLTRNLVIGLGYMVSKRLTGEACCSKLDEIKAQKRHFYLDALYSMARTPSAIISPAFGPMMWIPRIRSV